MTAIELLAIEPVVWRDHLAELSIEERESLASNLSHLVERAGLARGYIDGAFLFGTGSHDRGVKAANHLRAKVRTALGFAYPKSGQVSF